MCRHNFSVNIGVFGERLDGKLWRDSTTTWEFILTGTPMRHAADYLTLCFEGLNIVHKVLNHRA